MTVPTAPGDAHTAWRLSFYYAALFAAVGTQMPYWPLWLKDRGMDGPEIGLLMATTYLTKVVIGPLAGHVADRRGERRRPMIMLAAMAAVAWCAFSLADDFGSILAVSVVALSLWSGVFPLGESLALHATQAAGLHYGRVRLWGSLSFIAAATSMGVWLKTHPAAGLVWAVAAGLGLLALACHTLREPEATIRRTGPPAGLAPLLRWPPFLTFLAIASLGNASHTVYYAFATIHWRAAGIDADTIGLLWAEGVVAEVVLFAFASGIAARLGPARLLLIAAAAAALRWLVLGATTALGVLAAAQLLHAASFGCAHLGAMMFITRAIPAELSARAQGLLSAVALGAVPGLLSPASGWLYQSLTGGAFWVMAVLAAAGAALAWRLSRRWDGARFHHPQRT